MDDMIPISLFLLNVHLIVCSRAAADLLSSSSTSISPRLIVTLFLLDLGDLRRNKWLGVVSELLALFFGGGERGITSSLLFVMTVELFM